MYQSRARGSCVAAVVMLILERLTVASDSLSGQNGTDRG